MRLEDSPESQNVEDRRGVKPAQAALGGGVVIVLMILSQLLGIDPRALIQVAQIVQAPGVNQGPQAGPGNAVPKNDAGSKFVRQILGLNEEVWSDQFQQAGKRYEDPSLVMFTGSTNTACGLGQSAMGPFYCPGDKKVYIDLAFFDELDKRFGAPGDFAQAYVIAHEVGHHVQNLLGYSARVQGARRSKSEAEANKDSVRLELQADYLAGVWAHHANLNRKVIEPGDIEEGLRAATAIGDDTLQKQATGRVVPDSFTHGTSAQRLHWFREGIRTGDFKALDRLFTIPYGQL
ncbi:MAG: neutral zinc metallopeptidase [Planctomycetota bacterium]|nr:zinc metallopeptidase [Planctomycetota bacterium]